MLAAWEFVLPCQTVVLNKGTFMRICLVLLAAVGALTGCQTFPPGAERGPHGTMAYQVPVEASDAGVKVYANGELVGETPFTLKVFGDLDGTFHNFGSDQYVLQAVPTKTNQFAQIRVFQTGGLFMPEDRIPASVHFDMNQPLRLTCRLPGRTTIIRRRTTIMGGLTTARPISTMARAGITTGTGTITTGD